MVLNRTTRGGRQRRSPTFAFFLTFSRRDHSARSVINPNSYIATLPSRLVISFLRVPASPLRAYLFFFLSLYSATRKKIYQYIYIIAHACPRILSRLVNQWLDFFSLTPSRFPQRKPTVEQSEESFFTRDSNSLYFRIHGSSGAYP